MQTRVRSLVNKRPYEKTSADEEKYKRVALQVNGLFLQYVHACAVLLLVAS